MSQLLDSAIHYHRLGFNITHVVPSRMTNGPSNSLTYTLKAPSHNIEGLETERQSLEDVLKFDWGLATGVGVIMNYNKFRVLDIDGCSSLSFIKRLTELLDLPEDYPWIMESGSLNGYHILFRADDHDLFVPEGKTRALLPNEEFQDVFDRIELRWKGHLVMPPSLHKSGHNYRFLSNTVPDSPPIFKYWNPLKKVLRKLCQFDFIKDDSFKYFDNFMDNRLAYKYNITSIPSKTFLGVYSEPFVLFITTESRSNISEISDPKTNSSDWPNVRSISYSLCDSVGKRMMIGNYSNPDTNRNPDLYKITDKLFGEWIMEEAFGNYFRHTQASSVTTIVAHNIDFHLGMIISTYFKNPPKTEGVNHDYDFFLKNVVFKSKHICTMKSTMEYCGLKNEYGLKYPRLEELHVKLFEEPVNDYTKKFHPAEVVAKCFWKAVDEGVISI